MRNNTRARAIFVAVVGAVIAMGTPTQAEAQGAVINGKVTSEFGANIEGANVYISDLSVSILTNAEGNYTISLPAARVNGQLANLRVRAVGYQPQVRPVRITAGTQTFNFVLKQDVNRLDEIVVTGVVEGVERAKVPFAVARLTSEDIPVPAIDPLRALQGKVAGVRIAQTSGQPGSTPEILMRGPTSINASGRGQEPLYIVDGVISQGEVIRLRSRVQRDRLRLRHVPKGPHPQHNLLPAHTCAGDTDGVTAFLIRSHRNRERLNRDIRSEERLSRLSLHRACHRRGALRLRDTRL